MQRTFRLIQALAVLCGLESGVMLAQTPLPLGDAAPAGNVLRVGHSGRQIGDIERFIHFYHDVDIDVVMSRMKAAGMKTVATSGKPLLIGPTAPALFTQEMNNFFVEFIARASAPTAAPSAAK